MILMKRKALALTFIVVLLFLVFAGMWFVNRVVANPYIYGGYKPSPEGTPPPLIFIFSPNNNTVFASNNVTLTFNVTMLEDRYTLSTVYFVTDWEEGVYLLDGVAPDYFYIKNLTGIPEGKHRITISAYAQGYYTDGLNVYSSEIRSSSSVWFSIEKQIIGKPFPTVTVAVASAATIVVVGVSRLVYFKKRRAKPGG